jgi:hypothetical protein
MLTSIVRLRTGCPQCAGNLAWDHQKLLKAIETIHLGDFDTSCISPEDVANQKSKITLICNKCHHKWSTSISSIVNNHTGCPRCRSSKGEKACYRVLLKIGIIPELQHKLVSLRYRRFDLMFMYRGRKFLIEYDGEQHFRIVELFHGSAEGLAEQHCIDIEKTRAALREGCFLIRIDYTCFDQIEWHIHNAVTNSEGQYLYYSTPTMYQFIVDDLKVNPLL